MENNNSNPPLEPVQDQSIQNIPSMDPVINPSVEPVIPPSPVPEPQPKKINKMYLIIGGGVIILFSLIVAGYFILKNFTLGKFVPEPTNTPEATSQPTTTESPTPKTTDTPKPSQTPTPTPVPTASPIGQSQIKILSIAYFPIKNNVLNTSIVNNNWGEYNMTLEQVRAKISQLNTDLASTLEKGTEYKNYKNGNTVPAIKYSFYDKIELLEAVPSSNKPYYNDPNIKMTDYNAVVTRQNICDLVDNKGVKEVWIWSYTGLTRAGWESNFSSSYGDISNSDRDTSDLPVCKKSYTVYEYNYGRGASEATEDHIHQYEAMFGEINRGLFWDKYVGYFPSSPLDPSSGRRCGWAHYPPNGTKDYDWTNTSYVLTDCMDWKPDGSGTKSSINCNQWNCSSKDYFVFWMQNIPGLNNDLTYHGARLRNWWDFIGNFDEAMSVKKDLVY